MRTPYLLIAFALAIGCGKDETPTTDTHVTGDATVVVSLDMPPDGSRARLARVLHVTADRPVSTRVTLDDGAGHVRTVTPPHSGESLEIPIPGFRATRPTNARVEVIDVTDQAVLHTADFTVVSEPITDLFPEIDVKVNAAGADLGDTIFPVRDGKTGGYMVMVDSDGEVIFAFAGDGVWWRSVRLLDDGRLLLIADHDVTISDWGDLSSAVYEPPVGTEGYHHEAIPRPGGGFFAFTAGGLDVPNFPAGMPFACDPGAPTTIWDSIVVEADADGTPIQTWSLGERLDTHRVGWDSMAPTPVGPDWGHANGMHYVEEDDAFVISMRNQELILKLSRATGEIEWLLSNPWGWDPAFEPLRLQPTDPDHRWNMHQHAPEWLDGKLLYHDNGAVGDMPCGPPDAQPLGTRIVEVQVDEANKQVTQLWEWSNGLYSPIMGDADRLANGHVLATYGSTTSDENGVTHGSEGRGSTAGRIIEFDPVSGDVFWDIEVYEANPAENQGGFEVPRSQRIHSWWPGADP